MILPKEDNYYGTKTKMTEQIVHLLGGRVAEKLTLDDISTGASNDIMRATELARDMVTKYGFSEKLGPVCYGQTDEVFLGNDYHSRKNYSEEVAAEIDEEVRRIVEEGFAEAERILTENIDKLHEVAAALLEVETLDGEQFEALYTGEITAAELAGKVKDRDEEIKKANEAEAAERKRLIAEEEAREAAEKANAKVQIVQMPGDKSDEAIRAILMNINNAADSEKPSDKNKDGGEDGDDENGGSNKEESGEDKEE